MLENNINDSEQNFVNFVQCPPETISKIADYLKPLNQKTSSRESYFSLFNNSEIIQEWLKEINILLERDHTRAILVQYETQEGHCPLTYQDILYLSQYAAEKLGSPLVQNEAGDKTVLVYDRDRSASMHKGARYHQTREGGSIHTDNVNIPEAWEHLLLTCLAPGEAGGENILADGIAVHKKLKENYPQALKTLEGNFTWEMRGVSDALYEAPIITYNDKGLPLFRHLRPYMESAHKRAEKPLTIDQLYALDVLDALTNSSENQCRYRMQKGDMLITLDAMVLHGRTCFSDSLDAVTYDDYMAGKGPILKRTMERLWIQKH